jgi:transcriptional regulator with GAF, ATPase, and Fis domain
MKVSQRWLLAILAAAVCVYVVAVLVYVQSLPDIGIRSTFSPVVRGNPRSFLGIQPQEGDIVLQVGAYPIRTWIDLLNAPLNLRKELSSASLPEWAKNVDGQTQVRVLFERPRPDGSISFESWAILADLPTGEMVPSIVWLFLQIMLFTVGALVFWKRPTDRAAAQFFLLCIVTLGAYMGGYHWLYIATQPTLLLSFMVCAVLLPVVSLHFYLIFPRKKRFLQNHPRVGLFAIYGPPVAFLAALLFGYFRLRGLVRGTNEPESVREGLDFLRIVASYYLLVASLWYLASVIALIHSFITVTDVTERKQVQWILFGAVVALVPIGYSLYLALGDPNAFGAGAATWPMFVASLSLTCAFAISLTRYRLMQLDQIISSGVGYFLISFLAGMIYYAVVFVGTLIFNASPKLSEALTVSTTALLLMVALDLARSRLKRVLDNRFFREKTQLDRTLQRLGQAIEQLVDPPALAKRLLRSTSELLGVTRGAVFLLDGEPPLYKLVDSLGNEFPLHELSLGCPLVEAIRGSKVVMCRYRSGAPTPAQRQLQFMGCEVAQPLVHEGRLRALLVLGPKDAGYRPEDLDLLAAFTQITVLALESAAGHRTIELLNVELQEKVDKISEQQRRIIALQSQLRQHRIDENGVPVEPKPGEPAANGQPESPPAPAGIVGSSPVVRQLLHLVRKVATTDAVVLIRGESGTGKELLARAVHDSGARAGKAFVKVHCAALSPGLLESELFGHVRGAFTGAHRDKVGRFELANSGTLFLDEIGDISLEIQTKLLRVLQEKIFERVGSSEPVAVDVRILAATHQDLESLIRLGRFREDLFYRLNVFPIHVPPLRDRAEDIPELAMHFVRLFSERCHKEVLQIDDDALALLKSFSWPGNVRQLENVIERAVVITEGTSITVEELPPEILYPVTTSSEPVIPPMTVHERVPQLNRSERERRERELLVRALAAAQGNKAEAARALGLARSTLVSRLKKLGLS